jgi:hypothetical protein
VVREARANGARLTGLTNTKLGGASDREDFGRIYTLLVLIES